MPRATTTDEGKRVDLKSLDGAYVVVKALTYGQYLHRRDIAMQMTVSNPETKKAEMGIAMAQEAVTRYEFEHCILEHNLEDQTGRTLNFAIQQDFNRLEPKVGEEIAELIDSLHSWEDKKDELFQSSG